MTSLLLAGVTSEAYECVEMGSEQVVDDSLCVSTDKPDVTSRDCNPEPCFINTYK